MKAKWIDDIELGEVLMLHPDTEEEDHVLGEIRNNPELLLEWYKYQKGRR